MPVSWPFQYHSDARVSPPHQCKSTQFIRNFAAL